MAEKKHILYYDANLLSKRQIAYRKFLYNDSLRRSSTL